MTREEILKLPTRERKRALGICINGQLPPDLRLQPYSPKHELAEHGPPVPGRRDGKCARCVALNNAARRVTHP